MAGWKRGVGTLILIELGGFFCPRPSKAAAGENVETSYIIIRSFLNKKHQEGLGNVFVILVFKDDTTCINWLTLKKMRLNFSPKMQ